MTDARLDDPDDPLSAARIVADILRGAAVQAAFTSLLIWVCLDFVAWAFAIEIPILRVAFEYGIARTVIVVGHELGHVVVALAQGRQITKIDFSFDEAAVWLRVDDNAERDAWNSLAGPIGGVAVSFAVLALHAITGHGALAAAAVTRLCDEFSYLRSGRRNPQLGRHDGETVHFRLGDGNGLSFRQRRRLRAGYRITVMAAAIGAVVGATLYLWAQVGDRLELLLEL